MQSISCRLRITGLLIPSILLGLIVLFPYSAESQVLLNDSFDDFFLSNWRVVDEGTLRAPSEWQSLSGELRQNSQIFSDPSGSGTSPMELQKLGTYIWAEAGLAWRIIDAGDVNGDGRDDLVWRNRSTGATAVWLMNASGTRQEITFPGRAELDWAIQGVADINGDNHADVVWRQQSTGFTAVWLMNGDGFRQESTIPGGADSEWVIPGVGRYQWG